MENRHGGQSVSIVATLPTCYFVVRVAAAQDTDTVVPDLDDNTAFFAVFDGHGGEQACTVSMHVVKCGK